MAKMAAAPTLFISKLMTFKMRNCAQLSLSGAWRTMNNCIVQGATGSRLKERGGCKSAKRP
eukprot:4888951-Pyramimonas_sp.AAC.1